MSTKHTPGKLDYFKCGERYLIRSERGNLAETFKLDRFTGGLEVANAARFVECWNSHDALVAERDRLREALEGLLDCIHDTSDEDEAREKARAALNR